MLSHVRLFSWTVAHQASLSIGFPRQEYWSGLPFPPPGDLPDPGIRPASPLPPALQADCGFFTTKLPGKSCSSGAYVHGSASRLSILSHWSVCPFLFQYSTVLMTIALQYSPKSESVVAPNFVLFSQDCFCYWGHLWFHIKLRVICSHAHALSLSQVLVMWKMSWVSW